MTASIDPRSAIHFLRDCYRSDNREQAVLDLLARKVEYRLFLERAGDLLDGTLDELAVAEEGLVETARVAAVQKTERALELAVFPVIGRLEDQAETATTEDEGDVSSPTGGFGGKRRRRLFAPLIRFPLRVEEETHGVARVAVDLDRPQVNGALLGELARDLDDPQQRIDTLVERLPRPPYRRETVGGLAQDLEELFGLDTEELLHFPEMLPAEAVLRIARRRKPQALCCLPAAVVILHRRSVETRGVLAELAAIADGARGNAGAVAKGATGSDGAGVGDLDGESSRVGLSAPLHCVLSPQTNAGASNPRPAERRRGVFSRRPPRVEARVPAILSAAQRRILDVASHQPISMVVGPPGTGKSFTIAALAVDALHRGESVLVVSQKNHAVDVVADKIDALVGGSGLAIRGGRRHYRRELKSRLEDFLAGILPFGTPRRGELAGREDALRRIDRRLRALERELTARCEAELRWGVSRLRAEEGASRWGRFWGHFRSLARPPQKPELWVLMAEYQRALDHRIALARALLQARYRHRLQKTLDSRRQAVVGLVSALRARTAKTRHTRFLEAGRPTLFSVFPVWLSNLSELGDLVPPEHQLFDLVIFDEATQIDLASAVPALQRARRAVVVGDPKQLRHLSFLARTSQRALADQWGLTRGVRERLDYREKSLLDVVSDGLPSQEQVTFLDEHFRSAPPIIAFSNREFYGNRLRVMRDRPTPSRARDGRPVLRRHRIEGRREESGANPVEAAAVVSAVVERIAREADHPTEMRHSLGVLSPFRSQVELLSELLGERLTRAEIERHDLKIGSPFAFQGEERDVMYLSLALDAATHPSAFRFADRTDVFNVAITRARSLQRVFTSLDARDSRGDLLRRYLEHLESVADPRPTATRHDGDPPSHDDRFLDEVARALEARGCRTWPAWPVAGFVVDLVVARQSTAEPEEAPATPQRCVGVDLVGYPGDFADAFHLERYRVFDRAGLALVPIPWSTWLEEPEACLAAILGALDASADSP